MITPYNRQVETLRLKLQENLSGDAVNSADVNGSIPVNTVDSFQGQEADVVILSLVRSNDEGTVGFLSDYRRLNVAVTRARKHVLIIGNAQTICNDEILASLYEYSLDAGKVVMA